MRTIRLTLGDRDDAIAGHELVLEELDTADRRTTCTTLPTSHVEESRPKDDHDLALDAAAIRLLVLREKPLPSGSELKRIGTYLHDLLAYGKVGERWDELRALHPREQAPKEGLRMLLDVRDPELRPLPWELARRGPVWVFADEWNAFARIGSNYSDEDTTDDPWPLRIAVVVGAEDGDPEVDVDAERDRLVRSLAKVLPDVDPEFIVRPAENELPTLLEDIDPHVLHFIGHGEASAEGGVLVIMHDGSRWDWTAEAIANLKIRPRIAVLNACRSGDLEAQDGTWQVADAFREYLGVPAVVAMQGDIEGRAATAFAAGLFESLLGGSVLDVAVAAGRSRAANEVGLARRDFALPTLTLGEPADRVVPKRYAIDEKRLMRVQAALPVAAMVDRTCERRQLLTHLYKDMSAKALLTTVAGEQQVGKTELVRWALRQLAYRGRDVVYVDLRTPDKVPRTQVGVLRAIRDEVQAAYPAKPEDPCSFHTWTRNLNHLVHGEPPPTDPVTAPVPDAGDECDADPADVERIFAEFLDVLAARADRRALLIALDHLEAVNAPDLETDVMSWLIKPIRANRCGRVQLVAAGTATAAFDTAEPGLALTVTRFEPKEVRVIATQYLVYHDCWSDNGQRLVDALRDTKKPWMPENLKSTLNLARSM